MNKNNIAESIFDSISLIVEKRIANLEYDKTIICTVISDDEAKNNIYTVTDGSTQFKVQGDGAIYKPNDQVRVLIIEGDFTKEKYIQGKHRVDDTTKPITYVSPLDTVLKITDNLLPNASGTYGIAANGAKDQVLIGQVLFDKEYIQSKDIFDTLYLHAEFQTNFDQFDMRQGDYGLHVKLITYTEDPSSGKTSYGAYGLDFSATKDMFGNPYAFKIFTLQEIKYSLSQWPQNTVGLQLFLYQNNNFKYYDDTMQGELQSYTPQSIQGIVANDIKVSNVVIGFGAEVSNASSLKLKLYTSDIETYHSEDDSVDNRLLKLLWYNQSEDNVYIGFSDGIYDENYDELEYLNKVALNTRLLQQRSNIYPEDELSLNLAADIYDIKAHGEAAAKIVGTELRQLIQGFKDYTFGISWDDNPFSILLGAGSDSIGAFSQNISNATRVLGQYYHEVLSWARDNTKTKPDINNTIHTDLFNYIDKNNSNSIIAKVNNLFTIVLDVINTRYISYMSVYNTYHTRWSNILTSLENLYNKMVAASNKKVDTVTGQDKFNGYNNIENLNGILDGTVILSQTPYIDQTTTEDFKSQWDNRYCIYWYRKDESITETDPFLGAGWERLSFNRRNIGLPAKNDETDYCKPKTSDGASVVLRRRDEECFIAVLFHNHKKIISNELIFDNLDEVPNVTMMDAAGALYLEHGNDSQDSYQLYGPTGLLINAADIQKRRQLRVRFNGETGGDEQLIGATVYWYVPNIVTMLEVFSSDIGEHFNTDRVDIYANEEALNRDYDRGRLHVNHTNLVGPDENTNKYLYYNINPIFKTYKDDSQNYKIYNLEGFENDPGRDPNYKYIVKIHDENLLNITYQIYEYKNDDWVITGEPFTKFIFGDANSNYYTPDEWETANSLNVDQEYIVGPQEGPFKYYKYNGTEWIETGLEINDLTLSTINIADYKPGYSCYYRTIGEASDSTIDNPTVNIEDTLFPYHIKDYYQQTATQNSILCVVKKNNLTYEASQHFSFSSFGNSGTDYTLTVLPDPEYPLVTKDTNLFIYTALYDFDNQPLSLSGAEFSWVGPSGYEEPMPQINNNELIGCIVERNAQSHCYNGILRCSIANIDIQFDNNVIKQLNLHTDIPIAYGLNQNLYIEGASSIVYDSNGSNPQYYKNPYILYDKLTNTPKDGVRWEIKHYKDNGSEETNIAATKYQPQLTDDTNVLIPSPMYITSKDPDQQLYSVVLAFDSDTDEILWAQPILIFQDEYGSALINKWNGGLSIDEENKTILSAMVGAGRKDEQNRFEGVLMGDVGTGSGNNAINTVGLYGFHQGATSFGFMVDGTAFLGKAGKGRIEFDGTESTITSMHFKNGGSGLCIDLDSAPYLEAHGKDGQTLLYMGDEEYYLSSANYVSADDATEDEPADGMQINLQDGHIDAYNFKLTSSNILLDSAPEDGNDYFCIGNGTGNKLSYNKSGALDLMINNQSILKLSGNENYLQSTGYISSTDAEESGVTATGMKINLQNGHIDAYNFKLTSGNFILSNSHISPGTQTNNKLREWYDSWNAGESPVDKGDIIFKAGDDKFAITNNGYLFAKDGYFDGTIHAQAGGTIGGWEIGSNYLKTANYAIGSDHSFHMYSKGTGSGSIIGGNSSGQHFSDNWMLTIGQQFGVDRDGKMYASSGWIGPFELSNSGLKSKFIVLNASSIVFPEQTSLSLAEDVTIGSDSERVYMQTTSKVPFIIQNLDGAGIKFLNVSVSESTNTSLLLKNIVVDHTEEFDPATYENRSYMRFSCDYEWTNGAPLLDVGIDLTIQIVENKGTKPDPKPGRVFEETRTFTIPKQMTSGKIGPMISGKPFIITGLSTFRAYSSGARKTSATDAAFTNEITYMNINSSDSNKTLYSLGSFCPETSAFDDKGNYVEQRGYFLGNDDYVWDSVVAYNINQKSDRNLKSNILDIDECYATLFDKLHPVSYQFKNGTSGRRHFGFIAQEIKDILYDLNINTINFAPYCDYALKNGNHTYSLRYTEFIPLNTWQIQKLKPRMTEAEERIYKLEQELAELKSKII